MEPPTDDNIDSWFTDGEPDSDGSEVITPILSTQVSKCSVEVYGYEVLSIDKLFHKMEAYINEINAVMDPPIPKSTAMALLDHFKWDQARFLEKYFDDYDKLFEEANISKPKSGKEKQKNNKMKKLRSEDTFLCEICFTENDKSSITGLEECGHVYCNDCWGNYLNCKVKT